MSIFKEAILITEDFIKMSSYLQPTDSQHLNMKIIRFFLHTDFHFSKIGNYPFPHTPFPLQRKKNTSCYPERKNKGNTDLTSS